MLHFMGIFIRNWQGSSFALRPTESSPMKARDDLFLLIKQLSPAEKKVLGMSPARHDYQLLFKALNDHKDLDEKEFLASKMGRQFAGNFSVRKNELYEKILQGIRAQRKSAGTAKAIEIQLREQLEDVLFLREKKLYDQCTRRLQRAKKIAKDHQLHEILLEILRIERSILLKTQPAGYSQELKEIHGEIADITEVIKNKTRMLYLYDCHFLEVRQHHNLRGNVNFELLNDLHQSSDLQDVSKCLSFEAESNFYFCHGIYQHLQGNAKGAWDFARTLYLRWQEQKGVQKVKPVEYRNVLQNYLTFCNAAVQYDDFDIALKQLLAGPFYTDEEEASAIDNGCYVNMQRCMQVCDWDGAKAAIAAFKNRLDDIGERLIPSRIMVHYLSFSRIMLVLEDWKSAASWATKVITEGEGEEISALVIQARVQEILALVEMNDLDKLHNRCRAAIRLLQKADGQMATTLQAIQAIQKFDSTLTGEQQQKIWTNLLKTLNAHPETEKNSSEFMMLGLQAKAKRMRLRDYLESIKG